MKPSKAELQRIHSGNHTRDHPTRAAFLVIVSLLIFLLGAAACSSDNSDTAPGFSLTSSQGQEVSLDNLLEEHDAVVMVFYRGYF